MEKIKGVNFGNWLCLEKWMSPSLFDNSNADDEYYLAQNLPADIYDARMRIHRTEYITERDFATLKRIGINAIRIPIPYFIFGDRPPFTSCIDELDRAFNWAEHYGMKILVDLHTVPLSANGGDAGGISGVCKWAQTPEEVDFTLDVLARLAERYGQREGLLGIEPVNEPMTQPTWDIMGLDDRFEPVDKELAAGSAPVTMEFLEDFYTRAYQVIKPYLASDKYIVFQDAFKMKDWKEYLINADYDNVMLDTHEYIVMAEMMGCEHTLDAYLDWINNIFAKDIEEVQSYVPVVVGEWCLFNSVTCGHDTNGGRSVLNGMDYTDTSGALSEEKNRKIYQALAGAQLDAWDKGSGSFYWSYKLLLDTVNDPNWYGWDSWDFGKSMDQGWFPENAYK